LELQITFGAWKKLLSCCLDFRALGVQGGWRFRVVGILTTVNTYLKVFGVVILISGIYVLGSALISGSMHIKGSRKTIRRQENPRDYWVFLGIFTFIFAVLVWAFLTS
jgi:hypothetical protein